MTREEAALKYHLEVWKICKKCLRPATVIPGRHIKFEGYEPTYVKCYRCDEEWKP